MTFQELLLERFETPVKVFQFMTERTEMLGELTLEHFYLIFAAAVTAIVTGVIIGVIITYNDKAALLALTICQVVMVVPSFAMLGFLLPFFGIGFKTGMLALTLYTLLPVVRNTYTGIREIPPSVLEAAKGMGMKEWRILTHIKVPLALPVIMAGFRTAVVMIIGIGAIAAYIGAGGLGELIFTGISRTQPVRIIVGAILISLMAIMADIILGRVEDHLMSKTR